MRTKSLILGASVAVSARSVAVRLLRAHLAGHVRRLNAGDYSSLLGLYDREFVLHFHAGEHRWAGDWAGRVNFDRFLQNFVAARIQGRVRQIAVSGPPWALTLWVRFDDCAADPDGELIYENQTALVLRTRWGKVVEQHGFYAGTEAIAALEAKLSQLGIEPVPKLAASESELVPR